MNAVGRDAIRDDVVATWCVWREAEREGGLATSGGVAWLLASGDG